MMLAGKFLYLGKLECDKHSHLSEKETALSIVVTMVNDYRCRVSSAGREATYMCVLEHNLTAG